MPNRVSKILFQRVVLVSLFILLQVGVMLASLLWLSEYRTWVHVLLTSLSIVTIIYLICDRTNSSYKIAWIILILAFPVAGISIYLVFGGRRLSRPVRQRMQTAEDIVRENLWQEQITRDTLQNLSDPAAVNSTFLHNVSGYPVYDNTETTYYPLGDLAYSAMLEALKTAEKYIFLEYFIISQGQMWDGILEILKEKAAQGVDVRVMYDDFGCITTLPGGYDQQLAQWGIRAKAFNPFVPVLSGRLNNRDHRKLLIVDGSVGFTGGMNLADEYINEEERYGHWKDAAILLQGVGAWAMTVMFLSTWDAHTGEQTDLSRLQPERLSGGAGFVQPFSDNPLDEENVSERLLLSLFQKAVRSIHIMTPYLILDDNMIGTLMTAAKSGVEVEIITPHVPDKWYVHAVSRAHYETLTAAGVRIYEYTPGFIHSKVYLVDDRYAVVGTVNLDFRSLYLHFENAVFLVETDCIAQVAADFETTIPQCREITWDSCRNTNLLQRFVRTALRLLSPLL